MPKEAWPGPISGLSRTMDWILTLLPAGPLFLTFMAAVLVLNLTPGADMTYVIARSISQGREAGLVSALGITAGTFIHTFLAAVGVSALLAASETGFLVVKILGAAFLAYLALRMLLDRSALVPAATPQPLPLGRIFVSATLVNVLNPKVALFVLAFLPQFIDPARGPVWAQILILGILFNASSILVNCAVALAASAARQLLTTSRWAQRLLRGLGAGLMGYLALRLAFSERT